MKKQNLVRTVMAAILLTGSIAGVKAQVPAPYPSQQYNYYGGYQPAYIPQPYPVYIPAAQPQQQIIYAGGGHHHGYYDSPFGTAAGVVGTVVGLGILGAVLLN